jgi:tetratricopeptide (TPR) repeat protein/CHAT domain-containing protein
MTLQPTNGTAGNTSGRVRFFFVFRALLGLLLLAAAGSPLGLLAADEPKPDLTPEQRQDLEQRSAALNQQAIEFYRAGRYAKATDLFEQSLAIQQKLYPKEQYPQGHPDLARSLNNLGDLLQDQGEYGRALPYFQQALAMYQKLHPKEQYPQGHPNLARSLNNLGGLLLNQGEYGRAFTYYQQSLAIMQQLYPEEQYPQGHPDLATSLNNLGSLLGHQGEYGRALPYFQQALAMYQKLYPAERYPQGHPDLAASLNNLGMLLRAQGEYGRALTYYQQALAMVQKLYPAERYPQGHPHLAGTLNNLGLLLQAQGEHGRALTYHEQALAMQQQLYPAERFPQGHPGLARSLNTLGALLRDKGEYGRALTYHQQALAMYQKLYPKKQYRQGHPDLATSLNNLGFLLQDQGEYGRAFTYYQQALAMRQQLYPAERFPQGHPDLAMSLNNLGSLLQDQGEYGRALPYFQQALAIWQQLYPEEQYRQGHPDLATSLNNLGFLLQAQGEYGRALTYAEQAVRMHQDLFDLFAAGAAEAEALNFLARLSGTEHLLLSVSQAVGQPAEGSYALLWRSKGAVARLLESRRQALIAAADPETAQRAGQLSDTRRALAQALLAPAAGAAQVRHLAELTQLKEERERALARKLPAAARRGATARQGPADLAGRLPPGSAFLDLIRYYRWGKGKEAGAWHYTAFVLRPGQPVVRVELGLAAPIDAALTEWRGEIGRGYDGTDQAATLRRLVWAPLAKHLPADTETVWLSPDGLLSSLPWAALPGRQKGTVLLEGHALAVVSHGPFLLDYLSREPAKEPAAGLLVAYGGVAYDSDPRPVERAPENALVKRAALDRGKPKLWVELRGTERERELVVSLAKDVRRAEVLSRQGRAASTGQLLLDLPRARWAHLATHGFFANAEFRSVLQVDEKQFRRGIKERAAPGARNPLVLSGLVLAGANRADPDGDRGILTAEAIAGLPLDHLELAVLSACETGLGEVAGGEGVFGLQRAFHLAGASNVVASLWQVEDTATAALMGLFYRKLWVEKKPPLAALREAQLYLYRHPEQIASLAAKRGVNFANPQALPADEVVNAKPQAAGKRAKVSQWAAFVLSGAGR